MKVALFDSSCILLHYASILKDYINGSRIGIYFLPSLILYLSTVKKGRPTKARENEKSTIKKTKITTSFTFNSSSQFSSFIIQCENNSMQSPKSKCNIIC